LLACLVARPPRFSSSGIRRDQRGDGDPSGGAVSATSGNSGTIDQRRQADFEDDAAGLRCLWAWFRSRGALADLGNLWQRLVLPNRIGNWSLTSLLQRLVKTGGRSVKQTRYNWLLVAESFQTRRLFGWGGGSRPWRCRPDWAPQRRSQQQVEGRSGAERCRRNHLKWALRDLSVHGGGRVGPFPDRRIRSGKR
jgi:hypothetical protein